MNRDDIVLSVAVGNEKCTVCWRSENERRIVKEI